MAKRRCNQAWAAAAQLGRADARWVAPFGVGGGQGLDDRVGRRVAGRADGQVDDAPGMGLGRGDEPIEPVVRIRRRDETGHVGQSLPHRAQVTGDPQGAATT